MSEENKIEPENTPDGEMVPSAAQPSPEPVGSVTAPEEQPANVQPVEPVVPAPPSAPQSQPGVDAGQQGVDAGYQAPPAYDAAPPQYDPNQQAQASYDQSQNQYSQGQQQYYDPNQQQAYGTQNPYYAPQSPVQQSALPGAGKATGAIVCGVLAIVLSGLVLPSIILGIVAIVFAGQYIKQFGAITKATAGRICGIIGIVLSVLALIGYIILFAVIGAAIDIADREYRSDTYSYPHSSSESEASSIDKKDIVAVLEDTMKDIKSPSDDQLEALAADYDYEFESIVGFTMADAGLDPLEVVKASLATLTYEIDESDIYEVSAYSSESSATAYVEVSCADIYDFLVELELMDETADAVDDPAKLGELFKIAMDKADPTDYDLTVELEEVDGTWVVDQDALETEIPYIFGTY